MLVSTPTMASAQPVGRDVAARQVYLDYAAATPLCSEALAAAEPYLAGCFYNPSAPYAPARQARAALEEARSGLAHLVGGRPAQVTLTAGATEANNLALASVRGAVLTDAAEHESVLAAAEARDHVVVGVGPDGLVDPREVAAALTPQVGLVSVALANGEVGAVQPVRELSRVVAAERARRLSAGEARPLWLHVDASQAAGHVSVNVSTLGADLLTLSAAKVYGPKQVGLLWAADGVALRPLVLGGGQEGGVRSGTENVAGAVAFARALEVAESLRPQEARREAALRTALERRLREAFPWCVVSGPRQPKRRLPGLLHVSFPLLDARRLVILLERRGVLVGTGSACAASRMRSSHVLAAMGVPMQVAQGSLRITVGRPTAEEDVAYAAEAIEACVRQELARQGLDEEGMPARVRAILSGEA